MGIQAPQLIQTTTFPLAGRLRSGNILIPDTVNTQYLFDPLYLPTDSPFEMRAYYPDLRTYKTVQNFNYAYPGLEWAQPLWAYGANHGCVFELTDAPAGMSVGNTFSRNPVTGFYGPDANYGVITWQSPILGRYRFGVRATDQKGRTIYWLFDLRVTTEHHYFMALNATGDGSGSSPANYASYANTIIGTNSVSPSRNKVLHIKGDDYPSTVGVNATTGLMAASWVAMPGETPTFHQRFNITSDNISFYGIRWQGVGTSDFGIVGSYADVNNIGFWRCEWDECFKVGTGNNNNSCFGLSRLDNGYGRHTFYMGDNVFKNCTGLHGYDFYTVKDHVFYRNRLVFTNGTTVNPNSWIFPKQCAGGGEIIFNYADVPTVTSTSAGVIELLNSWMISHPVTFDLIHRVEYNFIRTGGANICRSNGSANDVGSNKGTNQSIAYIKRNTFIGGSVSSEFYNYQSSNTTRITAYESNIIINTQGGPSHPAEIAPFAPKTGNNIHGTTVSGVLDTNGVPLNTNLYGLTGKEIWRPL